MKNFYIGLGFAPPSGLTVLTFCDSRKEAERHTADRAPKAGATQSKVFDYADPRFWHFFMEWLCDDCGLVFNEAREVFKCLIFDMIRLNIGMKVKTINLEGEKV